MQTVSKDMNLNFHKLISEFKNLTGIPILLNTSFNDNGEPIVESPNDAIKCFLNIDLDYLVIGKYLIQKIKIRRECRVHIKEYELSSYGRLVTYTKSSMTELLEIYHNTIIKVNLIRQNTDLPILKVFNTKLPDYFLVREATLESEETGEIFLYAISIVFIEKFQKEVMEDLIKGVEPIGKILDKYKLDTSRKIENVNIYQEEGMAKHLQIGCEDKILGKPILLTVKKNHCF
ncbi:chorismate pyruvate-lyase family protein [Bacillus cereus]